MPLHKQGEQKLLISAACIKRYIVKVHEASQVCVYTAPKHNIANCTAVVGQDSTVGIATRYGLDGPGIESRWGARFSAPVQTGPGAHPASYTMGTGSFPGGKAAGAWR